MKHHWNVLVAVKGVLTSSESFGYTQNKRARA